MKKLFLLGVLSLCIFQTVAQEKIFIESKQSEIFKDNKKHTALKFTASDGSGGFVTVREFYGGLLRTPKGYYIDYYDANLKLKKEYELTTKNAQIKGIKIEDGTLYILQALLDKKEDSYKFNVLSAPLDSFKFSERTLLSFSEDDVKKYFGVGIGLIFINNGFMQQDENSNGDVTFSANENFFSVIWDIKDKKTQTQRIYVFDRNFEKVYEKDFKRNVEDRLFDFENVEVDDETGDVYLLGKVYENGTRARKKKGKANYHYELHVVSKDDNKSVSFKTQEKFASSLTIFKDGDQLSCVGFYSERNDSRYKGVCHFGIDANSLAITSQTYSPFDAAFLEEKYGKVKDKELRDLSYRSLFIDGFGNIYINAEEFYITTSTMNNMNGGSTTTVTYHYNDIVSVKLDSNGTLLWARNINKRQASGGSAEHLSFSATAIDGATYLFINCSDKIRKLRNDRIEFKQASKKRSNLYAIKIDVDGNYTYQNIIDDKESPVTFFVRQGITTNYEGTEMVFLGRKKSKKQFLKLNIQ